MITIALDEQGDFENFEGKLDKAPVFIGGVIYDDVDADGEYNNEKERLYRYLKHVCASVNCKYPVDLHFSSKGNNGSKVKQVKTKFSETIKEFLEKGTWNNEPILNEKRKGKYYVFASIRGENGKTNLLSKDISEAVKDDFASNLYLHMAEGVVERLVFHNPLIDNISKVRLDLATRMAVLPTNDEAKRHKEYETLGYELANKDKKDDEEKKNKAYNITNVYNYRTAFEREMLKSGQDKILVDRIGVKSICYDYDDKERLVFLFLADAICSILGFDLQGKTPAEWINEFYKRSANINPKGNNIIWAYDDADLYFDRAWNYLEDGDYYRALSIAYDGSICKSKMASFYKEHWFKYVTERVSEQRDASGFSMAVRKYKESVLNNNLNQEKLVYIYDGLESIANNIAFSSSKEEAELYYLYDSGMSAYIHVSNFEKAKECFEKAKQYAEYVTTEVYLRTRNKMVVFLCDNLQFEEALKMANENVAYHEMLKDMKKLMFGESFKESLNYAIAISQRAQVYAFMNDIRAEKDFLDALAIMDEGTPDRYITQSYLMHYYICQEMKDKYENIAQEYFGNKIDLSEQFVYIVKEGAKKKDARFSLKYALWVYVKAIYRFYLDELTSDMVNKFKSIEKLLTEIDVQADKQINGHPWELIYKYLALIMLVNKAGSEAEQYKQKIVDMSKDSSGLIKSIAEESVRCVEDKENRVEKYTYMFY